MKQVIRVAARRQLGFAYVAFFRQLGKENQHTTLPGVLHDDEIQLLIGNSKQTRSDHEMLECKPRDQRKTAELHERIRALMPPAL